MIICQHCGNPIERESQFCSHCGANISSLDAPPLNDQINEFEYRLFIGKNSDYYLQKFRKFMSLGKNSFLATWNWSAFFLGFIWFLYRKMFLWALLAFLIAFTPVTFLITMIAWGVLGNYLYFLHAKKKISQFKTIQNPMASSNMLAALGGVNQWVWVFGVFFFLLILGFIILGFLILIYIFNLGEFFSPDSIAI